jgi:hypothetical protein
MNEPFYRGQVVVVLNFKIFDGPTLDMTAFYEGIGRGVDTKGLIWVNLEGNSFFFPKERVISYEEWQKRNSSK